MKSVLVKAKEKAQKLFNEYIRLRDCYETTGSPWSAICSTCGEETDNLDGKLHAGHFIKDSKNGNLTSFDEMNVNAQCKRCNHYLNGNDGEYVLFILKKYGIVELNRLKNSKAKSKKWTLQELEDIYKEYKAKINLLNE